MTAAGWTCASCGQWVPGGVVTHVCPSYNPPTYFVSDYRMQLDRIAESLEKIALSLERIDNGLR